MTTSRGPTVGPSPTRSDPRNTGYWIPPQTLNQHDKLCANERKRGGRLVVDAKKYTCSEHMWKNNGSAILRLRSSTARPRTWGIQERRRGFQGGEESKGSYESLTNVRLTISSLFEIGRDGSGLTVVIGLDFLPKREPRPYHSRTNVVYGVSGI